MSKHFDNLLIILLGILVALLLGYVLRIHHEGKIQESFQSQAEKDLATLEKEFHSALENPHTFHIFNGRFEVYPVIERERKFHYRRMKDND